MKSEVGQFFVVIDTSVSPENRTATDKVTLAIHNPHCIRVGWKIFVHITLLFVLKKYTPRVLPDIGKRTVAIHHRQYTVHKYVQRLQESVLDFVEVVHTVDREHEIEIALQ